MIPDVSNDAYLHTHAEDPKDTQLRQYQEQIAQLKAQLEAKAGGHLGIKQKKKKKKKKTKAIRYDTTGLRDGVLWRLFVHPPFLTTIFHRPRIFPQLFRCLR